MSKTHKKNDQSQNSAQVSGKASKVSKVLKILGQSLLLLLLIAVLLTISINIYMIKITQNDIYSFNAQDDLPQNQAAETLAAKDYDAILILGAGIFGDEPSPLLQDRLDTGIKLYKLGVCDTLLMSGDHSHDHNEVEVMQNYALKQGVDPEHIILDHRGYSTYESIARAQTVFNYKRIIIVSQKFHLARASYLAANFNLEAVSVSCETVNYSGSAEWNTREILARVKDFFYAHQKPGKHS